MTNTRSSIRLVRRIAALMAGLAVASSCGGGDDLNGPPDPPGSDPVASVDVTPAAVNLAIGQTSQLSGIARNAGGAELQGRSITWTSADDAVATVDETGIVTAVAPGQVEVAAESEGKRGIAAVTVSEKVVATVTVTPDPSTVTVGKTAQLVAVTAAAGGEELPGRPVAWSTSEPGVATVDETGLVTGVAVGEVTIRATSEGMSGTSRLTVSAVEVATVVVDPATASLVIGESVALTAVARDADGNVLAGRPVVWSTDRQFLDVINVSATGRVTAVGNGPATIVATIEGKTGTSEITVSPPTGTIRTWKGGASGGRSDWARAANWNPQGKPISLDTVRIPRTQNAAVLSEDAEVARLVIAGGTLTISGHTLRVKAKGDLAPTALVRTALGRTAR